MSSYPTKEDICNLALSLICGQTIESISTDSKIENLCRLHLPQVRRSILRLHPWCFAIMRVKLPLSANKNIFGYDYRFSLPSDYLQLISLYNSDEGVKIDKFKVEGEAILCDFNTSYLHYVADVDCCTMWNPDFVECVQYKLAARLAIQLGAGARRASELIQEFEGVILPRAETNNAWEDSSAENNPLHDLMERSNYLNANNSGL